MNNNNTDYTIRNRNTNEDRIIIEKHYVPISLYRELYHNYNGQNQLYQNPYTSNPFTSQIPNARNYINQYRYNQPFFSSSNVSNTSNIANTTNTANTVPSVTEIFNNAVHPIPIHRHEILEPLELPSVTLFSNFRPTIFNDLINRHIPFNIQVNDVNATNNNYQDESPIGIPLSNINTITNVLRFCDIANNNNNNNAETCAICQVPFNTTDICRIINNCNHIFHINCIDTWLFDHTTCPFCRYDLLNSNMSEDEENLVSSTPDANVLENDAEYYDDDEDYDDEEEYEEEYEEANYDPNYDDTDYSNTNAGSNAGSNADSNTDSNTNSTNQTNPQVFTRVFTTSSNTAGVFNTEPILNDINNFVTITTPLINSFISSSSSNASVRLDSSQINNQINRQINNFVNNLNPLLQSFSNFGGPRN